VEQDAKESSGIARSQQSVLVLPHDRSTVAAFVGGPIEKVDAAAAETQLLVVTADAETAALVSGVASELAASRDVGVVPVTSVKRAVRLFGERQPQVVIGGAEEIVALVQGSSLRLGALRAIVLAWVDDIAAAGSSVAAALETVMAEVPKDAARIVVASRLSPEARELAERYARRGLRAVDSATEDEGGPIAIQYVGVSATNRGAALRRLLDQLDPARAVVWTRTADSEAEATTAIGWLGYRGASASVRVVRDAPLGEAGLAVLYDVPGNRAELLSALGGTASAPQIVALAQPRQMELLRALASGGRVTPLTLGGPAVAARRREESVRGELRSVLESGLAARELITLEPLLESYDGIEIAAAALRLLEESRSSGAKIVAESARGGVAIARGPAEGAPHDARSSAAEGTKIFLTVGERDGIRAGDLVGAIAGTAGIPGTSVGRVEIRDTHSLVEIVGADAETVASKITGISIKGRRVVARLERERPPREGGTGRGYSGREGGREGGRGRPTGDRAGGARPRSDRPRSDRPRSDRPRGRDDAAPRGGPRGERPRGNDDRPRRPREERGDR
jgi:ATP-dependent RNA helicase DeaD